MRCVGTFGRYRRREGLQGSLGRPEWKKGFGGTGHRYDGINKTDFRETERSGDIDWTGLAEW